MTARNSKKLSLLVAALMASTTYANADFVINDDLIVDGSACVGLDCVNGESFSFDTLILKENNLRILFNDTSVSASFPRTDWRLIANDSANGGQSHFSIENASLSRIVFKVDESAQANAIVADGSAVGFGTANPVTELHAVDGDTPTLRLEQDGSSGWSPQTWDVAGNETNFFIRDVTNGSELPFKIRPGAPDNSLVIAPGGDIGMGIRTPDAKFHVTGGDGVFKLSDSNANNTEKFAYITGSSFTNNTVLAMALSTRDDVNVMSLGGGNGNFDSPDIIRFFTGAFPGTTTEAERMRVSADGTVTIARITADAGNIFQIGTDTTNGNGASLTNAGVWTDASSRANKINIKELDTKTAIEAVNNLKTVTYNGKHDTAETYVGFIAEDVPDLVAMNNRKGIAAIEIAALLSKVVKEQQKQLKAQNAQLELLAKRLSALESSAPQSDQ